MPYKNFQAFKSEVEKEPITFDFHGEHYEVNQPSFVLKLHIAELFNGKTKNVEVSAGELSKVLRLLLGEENFNRFELSGADENETVAVLEYILNPYADDESSPNASRGKKGTRSR